MTSLIYSYYSPSGLRKNKNVSNSSRLVLQEAEKYGVKWKIIPATQIISLTYNGVEKHYYHQVPSICSAISKYSCNNKSITSNLLKNHGVSVPHGYKLRRKSTDEYIKSVYDDLKKPLVVKPSTGALGENISVNINSYDEYLEAVNLAFEYRGEKGAGIIVEEMFVGTEYRILATRKKVIGVLRRKPANVIGDGKKNIEQLIKQKNQEPIRGVSGGTTSHLYIRKDKKLKKYLSEQNLDLKSVLEKDQLVYLRKVSNISQGGDAIDFTDKIHPSVAKIALDAIQAIPGLEFAGVDFMTQDISKPQTKDSYVIIEINDSPGFDMHDQPYKGKNRHAAREFLFLMFPELRK